MTGALHPDDRQRLREAIEVARMVCKSDRAAIELEERGIVVDFDHEHGEVYRDWTEDDAKATTLVRTLSLAINVMADEGVLDPAVAVERAFDTLAAVVEAHH
jgi:hypothetical protein